MTPRIRKFILNLFEITNNFLYSYLLNTSKGRDNSQGLKKVKKTRVGYVIQRLEKLRILAVAEGG